MNKIISYLGFARKSNNIIIGQSSLKASRERIYLVIVCKTASNNLKDLANHLAVKHNANVIETNQPLSELLHLDNIKIIGIKDYNLSEAIKSAF